MSNSKKLNIQALLRQHYADEATSLIYRLHDTIQEVDISLLMLLNSRKGRSKISREKLRDMIEDMLASKSRLHKLIEKAQKNV